MKIITIVGISGSGKTAVTEGLTAALRERGCRVASVKYIACGRGCKRPACKGCKKAFTIDTPGSNSYRHRQAGSQLVITRAAAETAVMFQKELSLLQLLPFFAGYDYVLLEGDYIAPVPRIVTGREETDVKERLTENTFAVSGRAAAGLSTLLGLPAFDVTTPAGLSGLVEEVTRLPAAWSGEGLSGVTIQDSRGSELSLPAPLGEAIAAALLSAENIPADGEIRIRFPERAAL